MGIIENDRALVEVKYPLKVAKLNMFLYDAVRNKQIKLLQLDGAKLSLKRTHGYYFQV